MYIFICEESIDGIFTGVYDAWDSRYGHKNIQLSTIDAVTNYNLFYDYIDVKTDLNKSLKVARTLISRLGNEVYTELCMAVNALETSSARKKEWNKADAIYKTIVLALSLKNGSKVLTFLGEPYVNRVFQLSRSTGNEAHHVLGFLRFRELENGILFSQIHPKNDILPILAEHFTDRLPMENFIIYDENHQTAAVHQQQKGFLLVDVPHANLEFMTNYSDNEKKYQQLWCGFFKSIAIEARKNPKLQIQNIAKRFWKDTIEFEAHK
jgi:probable DNA metabolism protein